MTNQTQIDWTKAPADATHCHCISLDSGTRLWYKIKENQPIYYYATRNDKWLISSSTRQEIFGQYLYTRPQEPLFKVGDRVYWPVRGVKVYTLTENLNNTGFPLRLQFSENKGHFTAFSTNGLFLPNDTCHSIFHATSEKQQALEQLYGIKFEDPNIRTGSDLTRLKLEESNIPVLCYVSNESEADTRCVTLILKVNKKGKFISHNQSKWLYAVQYDKPIQTGLL